MSKFLIITTIDKPNNFLKIISKKSKKNNAGLVIVGDQKSPVNFKLKDSIFLSVKNRVD